MLSKILTFIKKHKLPLILVLISLVIFHRWLSFGHFTWADWRFYFNQELTNNLTVGVWDSNSNIGRMNVLLWHYPFIFLQGIFAIFGLSKDLIDKILVFLPIVILTPLAGYYLVYEFTKHKLASFLGGIIFLLNSYSLSILSQGHLIINLAIIFSSFTFINFKKLLDNHLSNKYIAYFLLNSFLTIVTDVRMFYILCFVMFFYVLHRVLGFNIFVRKNLAKSFENVKLYLAPYYLVRCFFILIILFLLNLYWILPSLLTSSLQFERVLERPLFGNRFWNLSSALTLHHPFWSGDSINWFENFDVPVYYWLLLLAFILGVFFNKRVSSVIFFAFISILGVFLSKQIDEPFGFVYQFLFDNFPGWSAFREPTKFYMLTIMGYSVVLGFFVKTVNKKLSNIYFYPIYFGLILIFLVNSLPILNGNLSPIYHRNEINQDYKTFNSFLLNQNPNFRTLWIPRASKYSARYYDRSLISNSFILNQEILQSLNLENSKEDIVSEVKATLENELVFDMLNNFNIKYVAVPVNQKNEQKENPFRVYLESGIKNPEKMYQEALNSVSYLEKIDIGTTDLAVYKNKNYKPYINYFNNYIALNNNDNIETKYDFIKNELNQNFQILLERENQDKNLEKMIYLINPFETLDSSNLYSSRIRFNLPHNKNRIYKNLNKINLYYYLKNGRIKIFSKIENDLALNGEMLDFQHTYQEKTLLDLGLDEGQEYYININNSKVMRLENKKETLLGTFDSSDSIQLFQKTSSNLIPNPNFEDGLWQEKVGNCHNFDDNPILGMQLNTEKYTSGSQSLQLEAKRHIACTNTRLELEPENYYYLSFDYTSPNAKQAGFHLDFGQENSISNRLPIFSYEDWENHITIFQTPNDLERAILTIYSYGNEDFMNKVLYDNFHLYRFKKIQDINISSLDSNIGFTYLETTKQTFELSFDSEFYDFSNLISNPDFENGSWQERVSNCNNFDNNPILGVNLNTEKYTSGSQSLQLEAKRHIACVDQYIKLFGAKNLIFSFDFQSPNSNYVGYNLQFNDPDQTSISKRIKNRNKGGWERYTKNITVPRGATSANLTIYGFSGNGTQNLITRYDNFFLTGTPNFKDYYFVKSFNDNATIGNQNLDINLNNVSTSKKNIQLKNITDPIFLKMSEGYHSDWNLFYTNNKDTDSIPLLPFLKPSYNTSEDMHFRTAYGLNLWYINPLETCQKIECEKNSDGSYNLDLTVKFWTQRWMDLGLTISFVTFLFLIIYLLYNVVEFS